VVGALDDIHIVLHNQNSVAAREETVEGGKGFSHVNFVAKVRKKICGTNFYTFFIKKHLIYLCIRVKKRTFAPDEDRIDTRWQDKQQTFSGWHR
jgi:hypothetical protein